LLFVIFPRSVVWLKVEMENNKVKKSTNFLFGIIKMMN